MQKLQLQNILSKIALENKDENIRNNAAQVLSDVIILSPFPMGQQTPLVQPPAVPGVQQAPATPTAPPEKAPKVQVKTEPVKAPDLPVLKAIPTKTKETPLKETTNDEIKELVDKVKKPEPPKAYETIDDSSNVARIAAINNLEDQAILETIALEDSDPEVRRAAVYKLKDEGVLERIAFEDKDPEVRAAAAEKISNQDALRRIAMDTKTLDNVVDKLLDKEEYDLATEILSMATVSKKNDPTEKEILETIYDAKEKADEVGDNWVDFVENAIIKLGLSIEKPTNDEKNDNWFIVKYSNKEGKIFSVWMTKEQYKDWRRYTIEEEPDDFSAMSSIDDVITALVDRKDFDSAIEVMALAPEILPVIKELGRKVIEVDKEIQALKEDLLTFFIENPNPVDSQVHDFAESKGLDPSKVEEYIYQFATNYAQFVRGGRSNEKHLTENNVDPAQLARGIEIEYEHTENEEDAKKIAMDHLAEFPNYYTGLDKMEAEFELEEKK